MSFKTKINGDIFLEEIIPALLINEIQQLFKVDENNIQKIKPMLK